MEGKLVGVVDFEAKKTIKNIIKKNKVIEPKK